MVRCVCVCVCGCVWCVCARVCVVCACVCARVFVVCVRACVCGALVRNKHFRFLFRYVDIFPEVKRPGHEVNHSPLPSTEVKNKWRYTSIHAVPSCVERPTGLSVTLWVVWCVSTGATQW